MYPNPTSVRFLPCLSQVVVRAGLAAWLALMANAWLASSLQAGCTHSGPIASAYSANRPLANGLEPSLLGKWQYVAGKTYYLFHPQPAPCDGPKCKPAPTAPSEMSTTPSPSQPNLPVAETESSFRCELQRHGLVHWSSCALPKSPELAGLLRPPQCAG